MAAIWAALKPVRLLFTVRSKNALIDLDVELSWGWIRRKRSWRLPVKPPVGVEVKPGPKIQVSSELIHEALSVFSLIAHLNRELWKRMTVIHFDFWCELGLGDAAATAVWTGWVSEWVAWWISSRIAPRALQAPTFAVVAAWDQPEILCNFTSIIQVRPSDIILATASGLGDRVKGGLTRGKPVRSGNVSVLGTSD